MPYPTSCYHTEYRCHTVSYISSMYSFSPPPRRHALGRRFRAGRSFFLGRRHTRRRVAHNKETPTSIMAWYVFSLLLFPFLEFVLLLTDIFVPATNRDTRLQPQHTHKLTHTRTHTSTRNRLRERVLPPTERPWLLAPPSDNLFHNRGFHSGRG